MEYPSGLRITWGAEHSDKNGVLIHVRFIYSLQRLPTCLKLNCLLWYLRGALLYALVANYEERRVAYAEENRHKKILDRYRTGEFFPKTIWQAIHANIKLTCPVCRKYNVDPLRG